MSDNDQNLAAKLIGLATANKLPRTGNHIPDLDSLKQLLPDGVRGRIFCSGCGTLLPVDDNLITVIAPNLVQGFDGDNYYLQVETCPACSENFVAVKPIFIPL
jgi:hypothetical protein